MNGFIISHNFTHHGTLSALIFPRPSTLSLQRIHLPGESTARCLPQRVRRILSRDWLKWPYSPCCHPLPTLPVDLIRAAYHDVHHDFRYIKKNYSQPFFTHWDWIMGETAG